MNIGLTPSQRYQRVTALPDPAPTLALWHACGLFVDVVLTRIRLEVRFGAVG